jgi:hypothetical protein
MFNYRSSAFIEIDQIARCESQGQSRHEIDRDMEKGSIRMLTNLGDMEKGSP